MLFSPPTFKNWNLEESASNIDLHCALQSMHPSGKRIREKTFHEWAMRISSSSSNMEQLFQDMWVISRDRMGKLETFLAW